MNTWPQAWLLMSSAGVAAGKLCWHGIRGVQAAQWGVDTGLLAGSDWRDLKSEAPTQLGFLHSAAGKHCKLRRA